MGYNIKQADRVILNFLGIKSTVVINYDLLFKAMDKIQATPHPKWPDYNFCFKLTYYHATIDIGENTTGLSGYFSELFTDPTFRFDAMRKCIFEWITWYVKYNKDNNPLIYCNS